MQGSKFGEIQRGNFCNLRDITQAVSGRYPSSINLKPCDHPDMTRRRD